MGSAERVRFPQDGPNWPLVRDLLTDLQEKLLNETVTAQDTALHLQVMYEACQSPVTLEVGWAERQRHHHLQLLGGLVGSGGQTRRKLDQSYLWFGVLKFLKKAGREEGEMFLFTTLPNVIELALRVEESMPPTPLCFSRQQQGGSTVLSRQLIASILACSFLCLFSERVRDRTSKLNVVNFTTFFRHLPQPSQIAKLRCVLHYFERTVDSGLQWQGSITFTRQVAERNSLPTLEELSRSQTELCPMTVHTQGAIEDVGSSAVQVDFANSAIGGGVLGRGRIQEEIQFSVCPELMAAMLFMERMEANEAIIISGFRQFSTCTGYAASLQFAGPFHHKAKQDCAGNLQNTLCAIDATSFRWGGRQRQYQDACLLREITKALVGFRKGRQPWVRVTRLGSVVPRGESSEREEEFVTASESLDEEGEDVRPQTSPAVLSMAEVLAKRLLSQGMVESVRRTRTPFPGSCSSAGSLAMASPLDHHTSLVSSGDLSPQDATNPAALTATSPVGQRSSTPREDEGQGSQAGRYELAPGHITGGGGNNGERLSLVMPRPQNGSSDILEVIDYSEWLANFRRRSSQLSDVTSRRSSSSTKHSSEFSSDLEEIYETLVQAEKAQLCVNVIHEEEGASQSAALSDYAAHFVTALVSEGTSVAAQMLPGLQEFQQGEPPAGSVIVRPQVVRATARGATGGSGGEKTSWDVDREDDSRSGGVTMRGVGGVNGLEWSGWPSAVHIPGAVLVYAHSLVDAGLHSGMVQAASCSCGNDRQDDIPDDVYNWFADKFVQEVLLHVVDELYFQHFTLDCQWRRDVPVNREGVNRERVNRDEGVNRERVNRDERVVARPEGLRQGEEVEAPPPRLRRSDSDPDSDSVPLTSPSPSSSEPRQEGTSSDPNTAGEAGDAVSAYAASCRHQWDLTQGTRHGDSGNSLSATTTTTTIASQEGNNRGGLGGCLTPGSDGGGGGGGGGGFHTKTGSGRLLRVSSCCIDSTSSASATDPAPGKVGGARKKSPLLRRTRSQSSPDTDPSCGAGEGGRDDRKSVTFTLDRDRHRTWSSEGRLGARGWGAGERVAKVRVGGVGRSPGSQTVAPSRGSGGGRWESSGGSSPWFVVKEVPVPFSKTLWRNLPPAPSSSSSSKAAAPEVGGSSRSATSGSRSGGQGGDLTRDVRVATEEEPSSSFSGGAGGGGAVVPSLSSSFSVVARVTRTSTGSNIPASVTCSSTSPVPPTPSSQPSSCVVGAASPLHLHLPSLPPASSSSRSRDHSTDQSAADSARCLPSSSSSQASAATPPSLSSFSALCGHGDQGSGEEVDDPQVRVMPSASSAFHTAGMGKSQHAPPATSAQVVTTSEVKAGATREASRVEVGAGGGSVTERDLNMEYYRAAAAIVNQVFQSIPNHLSPSELRSLQRLGGSGTSPPSSFYYQGRRYESVYARGSYETAAAVIGASEKGNIVSENFSAVSKVVSGVSSSEASSPRRTRSQSPCFSWLSKRLSRETLTNAFVKVESRPSVKSYERRSSEPCQRSVTLSLQAFNTSHYEHMVHEACQQQMNACTDDDDMDRVNANSWRRGSLDSISLSRRRSSCGFKDPVLSRFAQELIMADTSVPQLFLVGGSSSTSSTTGSRRSSMSGFRDTTLATFESELLNSSFTLSQSAASPRHNHRQQQRSHLHRSLSRESTSRLYSRSEDDSDAETWFPLPRRVGQEFQEYQDRVQVQRHHSLDEVQHYADFVATTILQQAVGILGQEGTEATSLDRDVDLFSENLADQVMREALFLSASLLAQAASSKQRRPKPPRSGSDSELEFSVSSNDLTGTSLEDRLIDFQDALDVSYGSLEIYAGGLADGIITRALCEVSSGQWTQLGSGGGRPIATGNWGCGAFCGDPCLKVALQWVAASQAGCPQLLYFTYHDQRLYQLPLVVDLLSRQRWTVGRLMRGVRAYCRLRLAQGGEGAEGVRAGRLGDDDEEEGAECGSLLDFLLSQPSESAC